MTTGIFAWIAAHAAEEVSEENQRTKKKSRMTPYWRTLKSGGVLNEKYPGGIGRQRRRLQEEGHTGKKSGKNYVVADFEQSLVDFTK